MAFCPVYVVALGVKLFLYWTVPAWLKGKNNCVICVSTVYVHEGDNSVKKCYCAAGSLISMQEETSLCIKIYQVAQCVKSPVGIASNVAQGGKGSQGGSVVSLLFPQCLHSW